MSKSCKAESRSIRALVIVLAASLLLPGLSFASETAQAVAIGAGVGALNNGVVAAIAPNPVSVGLSLGYGAVSLGASLWDLFTDPPPADPPRIVAIVAGGPTARDRASAELIAGGKRLEAAPVGRMISLIGTNFSWYAEEMQVTFDGKPGVISPLSSHTLVTTLVPRLQGPFPRTVEVKLSVKGQQGRAFPLVVQAPVKSSPGTADRVLAKLEKLARLVHNHDWKAQLSLEDPDLADDDVAEAMKGAAQMVEGSAEVLALGPELRAILESDPEVRAAYEETFSASPEMERDVDLAIQALTAAGQALTVDG